jgi:hypothetical protein
MRSAATALVAVLAVLVGRCTLAAAAGEDRSAGDTGPLVLLVQGDATVASAPAGPADPPEGATLRLRRVRVGEDGGGRLFRARGVLEAVSADGLGTYFTPVEGGRLMGPLRATALTASWTPHVLFRADAGLIRVPFSLSRQIDEADLRLPERAAITNTLAPDFRVGAGVSGDAGALSWAAAVMSSSRTLDADVFDRGLMVAARMAADPIGPVGATPWRRPASDPWTDWFRFRHGISFMYGTLYEAKTIGAGMDLSAQWRRFSATAEYIFVHAPSGNQQGAVVEPGITLGARRANVALRGEWQRAAGGNGWGVGAAITIYARDPRARLQAGFERTTGPAPLPAATSALARLIFAIN